MSDRVSTTRSIPIMIAPIEKVEADAADAHIKITPKNDGIWMEVRARGVHIGFELSQPTAHMLFEQATDLVEEIANPDRAQVIVRGDAKGASNE